MAQFTILRAYYTKAVVAKAVKSGALQPHFDHEGHVDRIPLPATMIHDLGGVLRDRGTDLRLYSKYPFPNRASRQLDAFAGEAWNALLKDTTAVISRRDVIDGRPVVRVAVGDALVAEGCVSCHNTRADTPKNDWKLGDLRGVLEVVTDIGPQLAAGRRLTYEVLAGFAAAGVVLTLMTVLLSGRIISGLRTVTETTARLAQGDLDVEVTGTERRDEAGAIADSLRVFKDTAVAAKAMAQKQALEEAAKEARAKTITRDIAEFDHVAVGRPSRARPRRPFGPPHRVPTAGR